MLSPFAAKLDGTKSGTEVMDMAVTTSGEHFLSPDNRPFSARYFRPRLRIFVEYVDGPFSHLENRWTFADTQDGSDVGFAINYEFRSRTLGLLMGAMFDSAFRKFAEAFERRADEIYGVG